jgi:hypothetical protein
MKILHSLRELESVRLCAILAEERPGGELALVTWHDRETRTHHPLCCVLGPEWLGILALGERLAAQDPHRSYYAVKFGSAQVLERLGGPPAPAGPRAGGGAG